MLSMASNLRVMASNFAPCFTQVFFNLGRRVAPLSVQYTLS